MSYFHHHSPNRSADLELFFEDETIAIDITEGRGNRRASTEALIHYTQVDGLIDALTQMRDKLATKYAGAKDKP